MRIWLMVFVLVGCGGSKPAAVPACSGVDYIGSWLADSGNTLVFQDDCTYEIALAGGDSCPDKGISKKAVVPGALYMDDYTKTEPPCSYDTATTSIALACTYELTDTTPQEMRLKCGDGAGLVLPEVHYTRQ